ncbi:hypothetical protein I552_0585 [Mycobacterium xenopi 3993]|nr:hypothetical protein I552_0585 [Mycobacterium xenopi 3993]
MSAHICGAGAAALTYLGTRSPAEAGMSGIAVFAGAVVWLDKVVDE